MNTTNTKVYLTNLGKYNEGILQGKWVDLPISEEEFENVLKEIGIDEEYEEYFITDYETDLNVGIGEFDSVKELNEIIEELENIRNFDLDKVNAIIEYENCGLRRVIEVYDDYEFHNGISGEEWEEELINECGLLSSVPAWLEDYITIDYESLASNDDIYDSGNGVLVRL